MTAPDVVGCLKTQTDPGFGGGGATPTSDRMTVAGREERSGKQEVDATDKSANVHVDLSQVGSNPSSLIGLFTSSQWEPSEETVWFRPGSVATKEPEQQQMDTRS